jgi:serine/threonine protein kinase
MASVHQRYRIIDKIDAGGMAEIYRGVAISIEGFEKPVAIKRILPSLCQDKKFVTMFLDEARLSMSLNQANVVQIYDIGQVDDTYFIAMEYVDGGNLRRLMQRALDQGRPIPVPIACFLIAELARALAYAHEKSGPDGKSLGIVHRDVSPPNVLVSRQGEVKLTDFGLARAASNVHVSDAGVVKGKFSYLSPEVVDGKLADPRADIYSAGIILWELLCARKLFAGKTDLETVDLVKAGEVPKPSTLRRDVEAELDTVVLRALAKNPKRRYQSAREFEQELTAYLFKHNLRVTQADLAGFLHSLDEQSEVQLLDVATLLRAEIQEQMRVGHLDATLGQVPLRPTDLRTASASKVDVAALLDRLSGAPLDDLAAEAGFAALADRLETLGEQVSQPKMVIQKTKKSPLPLILGSLIAIAAGAIAAWWLFHQS